MILEKTSSLPQTKRNYGIDLLRICAMFMVVLLHVLGPGGILFEVKSGTAHFAAAWLLEMAAFCAINCYGIISGFVGVDAKYKYSNLALIWLQVTLYSVIISLYYHLRYPAVAPLKRVIDSFFPVSNGYYWYFTAYVGMFIFIPLLNMAAKTLSKNQFKAVLIGIFTAFCVLPSAFGKDIFHTESGYSLIWLAFLYLIGAYIKKHGFFNNKKRIAVPLYFSCVLITWGVKLWEEFLAPSQKWANLSGNRLTQYSSPTMLLAGLALVVIFMQIKSPKAINKIIAFIAPCTFGVYIIHAHPLLWDRLITYKYASFVNYSIPMMLLCAVGSALGLFIILAAVDLMRHYIFKLLKIKPLLQKFENKLFGNLWG